MIFDLRGNGAVVTTGGETETIKRSLLMKHVPDLMELFAKKANHLHFSDEGGICFYVKDGKQIEGEDSDLVLLAAASTDALKAAITEMTHTETSTGAYIDWLHKEW